MSLEAVALDTETTGLDARSARIIEIAVIRIRDLEISDEGTLRQFINPQCPIPESSSNVHGLTEKDLHGAPQFSHIVEALEERIDGAIVVGHNIGYDLAVIDREYSRAGLTWKIPRFLDVRALARLADPHLASYELRALCDWLGVEITVRHRALPDALAAGQAFISLVPRLRSCGIRTLAEAEAAARDLPGEERLYQIGGWISPAQTLTTQTAPAISAVDSYPYRHRVRDVAHSSPVFVEPASDMKEAARKIVAGTAHGLLVRKSSEGSVGFLTATDLLQGIVETDGWASTLQNLPYRSLPLVADDDFLYRAIGKMSRLEVDYLGVVDRSGDLIGTISTSDLMRHRSTAALILGDEIDAAQSVSELGQSWAKLPRVVGSSLREGIEPTVISAIISAEIRNLTARAARLAEEQMEASGRGRPPCPYAVLVLGSAGRGDSLLNADQDNALVYKSGAPGGSEDAWFAEAGTHIADILHAVGVPYCSGGVMAKNPGCRHSLPIWKTVIAEWAERAGPKQALAADIFFDGVPVYGDLMLASDLMNHAFTRAEISPAFIAALAALDKDWRAPIGIFGRLVADGDGRIDLKKNGLLQLVAAARTLALRHSIRPTSTNARLMEIKVRSLADAGVVDRAMSAFATMTRAVLAQQVSDSGRGIRLSSRIDIVAMSAEDKRSLIKAMRAVNDIVGITLAL